MVPSTLSRWMGQTFTASRRSTLPRRRRRSHALLLTERLEPRLLLAAAPSLQWSVVGSGGGGALYSPSIDPANPAEMFVSSDMGQLFETTNSGTSWQEANFLQIQGGHATQVQFTEVPNLLYAVDYTSINGADTSRPMTSTDGGQTWSVLPSDPTGGSVFNLYADPNNHNDLLVSDYTNLYSSTDGGSTWNTVYTTANSSNGLNVAGAFFNGQNIDVGTSDGLLTSSDGGNTFVNANIGGIPAGQAMLSFAGATENGTTRFFVTTRAAADVYAGIQGYDYQYPDSVYTLDVGDTSWTQAMTGLSASSYTTYVGMAQNNIDVAYVAGGGTAGDPTVYKTSDGGASWTPVFLTANNQNIFTGWSGSGGDRGWTYGETALGFEVAPNDANHVIITDFGFAHQSTDGGANWSQLYVSPAGQNPENAPTPQGKSYQDSGLDNTSAWNVNFVNANDVIIANSDIGGTYSTDGGNTFAHFTSGNSYNTTYMTVTQPGTGNVYAATSSIHDMYQSTHLTDASIDGGNGAVLISTDNGATWQTVHNFNHPVISLAIDPSDANRMYASVINSDTTQGGIWVTNDLQDGAASVWTELPTPPRTQGHPFNVDVLNDGTVVATFSGRIVGGAFTDSSGVFVYNPGTQTWTDVSAPNMDYWTTDLTIDPSDPTQSTWYAGVYNHAGESESGGLADGEGGVMLGHAQPSPHRKPA